VAERKILIALTTLYLLMFITRNLVVKKRTGLPVRKGDFLVRFVISTTALSFTAIFLSMTDKYYSLMGNVSFLRHPVLAYTGLSLFLISIILCWLLSSQLKDSWRVGVFEDQKTDLITNGVYAYVRNPYFDSYFLLYLSLFLIRPSIVLIVLIILTVVALHKMVLNEEKNLLRLHGNAYEEYKAKTGRYLPRFR